MSDLIIWGVWGLASFGAVMLVVAVFGLVVRVMQPAKSKYQLCEKCNGSGCVALTPGDTDA